MKKIYFLILALLLANSVIAQNINFGFKGGFNISTQNFDPNNAFPSSLYTGFLVGFHAGAFINLEYQSFTIQPGLFYTTKGVIIHQQSASDGIFDYNVAESNNKFEYIEVAMNLLYHVPIDKDMVFKLGGGPYLAQGTSISISTLTDSQQISFDAPQAPINSFKSLDYGINFLGEMQLFKRATIGLQYGFGLKNISNNTLFPSDHIKNSVISITFGVLLL